MIGFHTMPINSAGILMYRRNGDGIEVLLVHPGGPFWRKRDLGAWSLPKGEHDDRENAEAAARREFTEELGVETLGPLQPLGEVRQRAGKIVRGYALEGDLNVSNVRSNDVAIEWPPRSGRTTYFPEIDRAAWFALPLAREKILASQRPFLDRLEMLWKSASRPHSQKVPV
jgi:predicted NUDIX family NTP pyrophosphohydrolase